MSRRGQEEIVGFVIVMVLVAVVFLILLGLSLRGENEAIESKPLEHLLQSALEYTTSCATRSPSAFVSVGDLLEECQSGNRCFDGNEACFVLNETLGGLIPIALNIGENRPTTYYRYEASYSANISEEIGSNEFISLELGSCNSTTRRGASVAIPAQRGVIISSIEACP